MNVDRTGRIRLAHGLARSEVRLGLRVTKGGASVSNLTFILHGSVLTRSKTSNGGDGSCRSIGGSRGHACSNRGGRRGRGWTITYSPSPQITARCSLHCRRGGKVVHQKAAATGLTTISLEGVCRADWVRITVRCAYSSSRRRGNRDFVNTKGGYITRIDLLLHQ